MGGEMAKKRVIVIGGGFGGLNCVQALKKKNLEVILVDKKNHHLFQPLLYQVATAALSPADIATPLSNATVLMGTVISINKKERLIVLDSGEQLHYDYLVLAPGARHSYFGNDEWEAIAPGLKTITDALNIREKVLISFEKAERLHPKEEGAKYLNFVIIGGGPTGVEMAGAIAEIAYQTMFKNFRRIKPETSKIFLIEGASRILPPFPPKLSERAQKDLEKMGVEVITGKVVTEVTDQGVQVGEKFIEAKNIIWAAGNIAAPILKTLESPLDRQGRVIVESDLSIPGHPEIFVIGDAACFLNKEGKPLPAVAPAAIQQGKYVGKLIRYQVQKERRLPFKYFDKGGLATIGKNKAVGYFRRIYLKGLIAWLAWGLIHILYLVSYRSQVAVILDWFFHYMTGVRGARLIHRSLNEGSVNDSESNSKEGS